MLTSFMATIRRLFDSSARSSTSYSNEQLLSWAQGCMLEGLPDIFYEARLDCERTLLADGNTQVRVRHQFRLTHDSPLEKFSPADDLYPTQCIEQALKDKNWQKASLVFTPDKAAFTWE